jgi:hypothetical protein
MATSGSSVVFAALLVAAPAHAAHPCDPLYNAGIKSIQTPHHVYTTSSGGRTARSGEAIFAGGVEYLLRNGQWTRSPTPQAAMIEAAREKIKTHPDTCTPAGDRTVDGQAVATYNVHNNETGVDSQVMIVKSSGLVHRASSALADGSRVDTRYEYGNVQAPAGVR